MRASNSAIFLVSSLMGHPQLPRSLLTLQKSSDRDRGANTPSGGSVILRAIFFWLCGPCSAAPAVAPSASSSTISTASHTASAVLLAAAQSIWANCSQLKGVRCCKVTAYVASWANILTAQQSIDHCGCHTRRCLRGCASLKHTAPDRRRGHKAEPFSRTTLRPVTMYQTRMASIAMA